MSTVKVRARSKQINQLIAAVAYYRMSSDKQDKSIGEQRREVTAWAAVHGYKIIAEYIDEGISGDNTAKRKDFQRMMRDADSGDFQAILCWDQDRFGRFDSIEAGRWIFPLRENGIHLATMAQGVINWDDFAGRMIYSIQQEGKHQQVRDLSRNTTRGLLDKAQRGEWVSGPTPFGYRTKIVMEAGEARHRLELADEIETSLVTKIFDDYESGASLRGLRDNLNSNGTNPRTGSLWNENAIKRMLSNPIYTGDFVWPMRSFGKYHRVRDGKVSGERGDIGEQIIRPANHPAIISREQFQRVAVRLEEKRAATTPLKKGGGFLLSGLLYCAKCGHKMYGFTNPVGPYHYYRCSGNTHYGNALCGVNNVPQDQLLDVVLSKLEEWSADPATYEQLCADAHALIQETNIAESFELLEAKKVDIDRKLKRAEERILIVDDDMVPAIQRQVRELREERQTIIEKMKAVRLPTASIHAENESRISTVMDAIKQLRGKLKAILGACEPDQGRAMLANIIERIDVKIIGQPWGKRTRYVLESGDVKMRKDVIKLVTGSSQRGGLT